MAISDLKIWRHYNDLLELNLFYLKFKGNESPFVDMEYLFLYTFVTCFGTKIYDKKYTQQYLRVRERSLSKKDWLSIHKAFGYTWAQNAKFVIILYTRCFF